MFRAHNSQRELFPSDTLFPSSGGYPASGIDEGESHAYASKDLDSYDRDELYLRFEITPENYPEDEAIIATFQSLTTYKDMASLVLGKDGDLRLRVQQNTRYPASMMFPGNLAYPSPGLRPVWPSPDTYPTYAVVERDVDVWGLYPSPNVYPSSGYSEFPSPNIYPSETRYTTVTHYPTLIHLGDYNIPTSYPGISQPEDKTILPFSKEKITINMQVKNPNTQNGEVDVLAQRENGKTGRAFFTKLNWFGSKIGRINLGVYYTFDSPYSLVFDELLISGDIADPDWYYIADYEGFKVATGDEFTLWQGSGIPEDEDSYSEPTDLRNLARYDYAKPLGALVGTPKGLRWSLP